MKALAVVARRPLLTSLELWECIVLLTQSALLLGIVGSEALDYSAKVVGKGWCWWHSVTNDDWYYAHAHGTDVSRVNDRRYDGCLEQSGCSLIEHLMSYGHHQCSTSILRVLGQELLDGGNFVVKALLLVCSSTHSHGSLYSYNAVGVQQAVALADDSHALIPGTL